MPGWMLTLTALHLSTPGANKGVKKQSSTPLSNRSTIFHCAVTLTSSCITLRPSATQLMRLPECSQIRIASSPFPHGTRFSRFSVRIPLTLCLWIPMSNLMRRGYLWDTSRPFIPPCPVVSTSSPRWFPGTKTLTSSLLMGPLLKFLLQACITVTIIAPQLSPIPYWWPILKGASSDSLLHVRVKRGGGCPPVPFSPCMFCYTASTVGSIRLQIWTVTAFSFFVHSALESGVLRYAARSAIIQTMTVSCSVRGAASGEKWLSNLRSLSTLILAKSINESRNLTLLENRNRTSGRKLLWRLSFQDFSPPFLLPKLWSRLLPKISSSFWYGRTRAVALKFTLSHAATWAKGRVRRASVLVA